MTAIRVRTPGNHPHTNIQCDYPWSDGHAVPSSGRAAREARQTAKQHGWQRQDGKDYCPGCWPSFLARQAKTAPKAPLTQRNLDLIEVALHAAAQGCQNGATLRNLRGIDPLAREYLEALDAVEKMRK